MTATTAAYGPWFIYALMDPRDDSIRYIGRTNNVAKRLALHKSQKSNKLKRAWLTELRGAGFKVQSRILEVHSEWLGAREAEVRLINRGFDLGWPLYNSKSLNIGVVSGRPAGLPCDVKGCNGIATILGICFDHRYPEGLTGFARARQERWRKYLEAFSLRKAAKEQERLDRSTQRAQK